MSMQYVLDYQPASLASLLMSGSPASMPCWVQGCAELFAELPADVQEVITRHEQTGFTSCPEYTSAVSVFYKRHLCRLDPWPVGLERTFGLVVMAGNVPLFTPPGRPPASGC